MTSGAVKTRAKSSLGAASRSRPSGLGTHTCRRHVGMVLAWSRAPLQGSCQRAMLVVEVPGP